MNLVFITWSRLAGFSKWMMRRRRHIMCTGQLGVVRGRMYAERLHLPAETRGNPLALLELPRGEAPSELAGGFGLPGALPLAGQVEDAFRRQIDALPAHGAV